MMKRLTPARVRLLNLLFAADDLWRALRHRLQTHLGLPPLAGAAGPGDAGSGASGDDAAGGSDNGQQQQQQAADNQQQQQSQDQWKPPTQQEWNETQRQQREATERANKIVKDNEERERKALAEKGDHEALAKTEREKREAIEAENEQIKTESARTALNTKVTTIASTKGFHEPTEVMNKLTEDELKDEASIRKGIERLMTEKPFLVKDGTLQSRQNENAGGDQAGGTSAGGAGDQAAKVVGKSRMSAAYAKNQTQDKTTP